MRLEELTTGHVRRAIDVYVQHAWPPGCQGAPRVSLEDVAVCETVDEMLECFEKDEGGGTRRYSLRVGNHRYPFMKFVVHEYLVRGEFFFSVDTHDNLETRTDSPDYLEWERLKTHNRDLKGVIERAWSEAKLPTHDDLRALAEELARVEREDEKRKRLLIVDDEANVAHGLKALLQARGYDVELAHDGGEVVERLERDPLPDLLLLDLEMPVIGGQEVLARMRENPRLRDLPVLLATASDIDLDRLQRVSGYLRKPYPRQVLCAMIARLLEHEGE